MRPAVMAILVVIALMVSYTVWFFVANLEHNPATTSSNARAACAAHDRVKELQNPGSTGAYVVCRDGYLTKVDNGGGQLWVHPIRWLP